MDHRNLQTAGLLSDLWCSISLSSADLTSAGLRSVLGSPTLGISDYRDSFGEGPNAQVSLPRLSFHASVSPQ